MKHVSRKKNIVIYFYVSCTIIALSSIYYVYLKKINFLSVHNIVFGVLTALIAFLIAIKAHRYYKETSDCRMALIAASFFSGGIFEILHFINSGIISLQFTYWYFEAFSYLSGLLLSIFFSLKPKAIDHIKFQRNVYLIYAAFVLIIYNILGLEKSNISTVAINLPIEITFMSMFIVVTLIYLNMRLSQKLSSFSPLILGIFLLTFSDMFEPTFFYYNSQYRFILHFNDLFALSLIYIGIKDILIKSDYFSIRNKFLLYNGILICLLYWVVVLYSAIVIGFEFQTYFKYLFFAVFLILIVTIYIITERITRPISNIIEGIKHNIPREKPKAIDIISNDEMGVLAKVFNENALTVYEYSERMKNYAEREFLSRILIESIRSSLDINEIRRQFVTQIGRFLKADRTFIILYDSEANKYIIGDQYSEYLSGPDVKSLIGYDFSGKSTKFYLDLNEAKKEIIFRDVEEYIKENNLENTPAAEYMRNYDVKSNAGFPILYKDMYMGVFILHFTKNYMDLSKEDIEFIRTVSNQAAIALYQAKLYNFANKNAEREKLLRKVIETIRSSLDINETLAITCDEVGKLFNVQRAAISEFYDKNDRSKFIPRREYKENVDIKGLFEIDYDPDAGKFIGETVLDQGTYLVLDNIQEANVPDYFKATYKAMGVKAALCVPIRYKEDKWGTIFLAEYKTYRHWTQDEIFLLETIAGQLYIAIKQAELYSITKQQAQRESIIRETISSIRSSLDINEIKKIFVTKLAEYFNADRVVFAEFSPEKNLFLPTDRYSEYIADPDILSFIGYDWALDEAKAYIQYLKEQGEFSFYNLDNYLKEHNLENSEIEKCLRDWGLKSSYNILITFGNDIMGFFCIDYIKNEYEINREDMTLLNTFSNQMGIAIYQSKLLKKEQQQIEKERILRKIIITFRETLDINRIEETVINELAQYFDADRAFIIEYDKIKDEFSAKELFYEYLSGKDVKSISDTDFNSPSLLAIAQIFKQGNEIIFSNREEFLKTVDNLELITINLYEFDIKSALAVPIYYKEEFIGVVATHHTKKYVNYTEEDAKFIRTVANQAGIAIYQARLFETKRKYAELFDTANDAIMLLDENGFFDCNQMTLEIFGLSSKEEFYTKHPAELSPAIQPDGINSMIAANERIRTALEKGYNRFDWIHKRLDNGKEFPAEVILKAIEVEGKKALQATVRDITERKKLFDTIKQTAEREARFGKIVTTFRSYLDPDEIKRSIVFQIGEAFNADRCFFIEYDENEKTIPVDIYSEYLPSKDEESMVGIDLESYNFKYWTDQFKQNKKELIYTDFETFIKENNLQGTKIEDYSKLFNFKAGIGFPLFKSDKITGVLIVNYSRKIEEPSIEDINFLKILVEQLDIALYQAKLYEKVKQTAERESLLREIIIEIKISQNLDQVYNYILNKLANLFNIDRAVFIEFPSYKFENSSIKYEYLEDKAAKSLKLLQLPKFCLQILKQLSTTLEPTIVNDIETFHTDEDLKDFFREYNVRSYVGFPFIRYNHDVKILGYFYIGSKTLRIWKPEEIDLLQTIIKSVINVVWDITKVVEIEELRNTFTATLAHDLQVPVIGEKRALEYITSRSENTQIKSLKPILNELVNSNYHINNLLTKLIEIYNFELGIKKLELSEQKISELLHEVYHSLEYPASMKSIKIHLNIQENLSLIKVDKREIKKVIFNILENAITYTPDNGEITIESYRINNEIITCIKDNGPGIKPVMEKIIFQRYAMARVIERKIGSGLSLYLTKQIVEAHGGKIWYETQVGKGTTFCFSLSL